MDEWERRMSDDSRWSEKWKKNFNFRCFTFDLDLMVLGISFL